MRIHLTTRMPDRVFTVGRSGCVPPARASPMPARHDQPGRRARGGRGCRPAGQKSRPECLAAELQAGPVQGSALLRTAVSDVCDGKSAPEPRRLTSSICSGGPGSIRTHVQSSAVRGRGVRSPARTRGGREAGVASARSTPALTTCHRRTNERTPWPATRGWSRAHGITVLHFTPRQIRTQPGTVVSAIRSALAAASFLVPGLPVDPHHHDHQRRPSVPEKRDETSVPEMSVRNAPEPVS